MELHKSLLNYKESVIPKSIYNLELNKIHYFKLFPLIVLPYIFQELDVSFYRMVTLPYNIHYSKANGYSVAMDPGFKHRFKIWLGFFYQMTGWTYNTSRFFFKYSSFIFNRDSYIFYSSNDYFIRKNNNFHDYFFFDQEILVNNLSIYTSAVREALLPKLRLHKILKGSYYHLDPYISSFNANWSVTNRSDTFGYNKKVRFARSNFLVCSDFSLTQSLFISGYTNFNTAHPNRLFSHLYFIKRFRFKLDSLSFSYFYSLLFYNALFYGLFFYNFLNRFFFFIFDQLFFFSSLVISLKVNDFFLLQLSYSFINYLLRNSFLSISLVKNLNFLNNLIPSFSNGSLHFLKPLNDSYLFNLYFKSSFFNNKNLSTILKVQNSLDLNFSLLNLNFSLKSVKFNRFFFSSIFSKRLIWAKYKRKARYSDTKFIYMYKFDHRYPVRTLLFNKGRNILISRKKKSFKLNNLNLFFNFFSFFFKNIFFKNYGSFDLDFFIYHLFTFVQMFFIVFNLFYFKFFNFMLQRFFIRVKKYFIFLPNFKFSINTIKFFFDKFSLKKNFISLDKLLLNDSVNKNMKFYSIKNTYFHNKIKYFHNYFWNIKFLKVWKYLIYIKKIKKFILNKHNLKQYNFLLLRFLIFRYKFFYNKKKKFLKIGKLFPGIKKKSKMWSKSFLKFKRNFTKVYKRFFKLHSFYFFTRYYFFESFTLSKRFFYNFKVFLLNNIYSHYKKIIGFYILKNQPLLIFYFFKFSFVFFKLVNLKYYKLHRFFFFIHYSLYKYNKIFKIKSLKRKQQKFILKLQKLRSYCSNSSLSFTLNYFKFFYSFFFLSPPHSFNLEYLKSYFFKYSYFLPLDVLNLFYVFNLIMYSSKLFLLKNNFLMHLKFTSIGLKNLYSFCFLEMLNLKLLNLTSKFFSSFEERSIFFFSNFIIKIDFRIFLFLRNYVEFFRVLKYNEYLNSTKISIKEITHLKEHLFFIRNKNFNSLFNYQFFFKKTLFFRYITVFKNTLNKKSFVYNSNIFFIINRYFSFYVFFIFMYKHHSFYTLISYFFKNYFNYYFLIYSYLFFVRTNFFFQAQHEDINSIFDLFPLIFADKSMLIFFVKSIINSLFFYLFSNYLNSFNFSSSYFLYQSYNLIKENELNQNHFFYDVLSITILSYVNFIFFNFYQRYDELSGKFTGLGTKSFFYYSVSFLTLFIFRFLKLFNFISFFDLKSDFSFLKYYLDFFLSELLFVDSNYSPYFSNFNIFFNKIDSEYFITKRDFSLYLYFKKFISRFANYSSVFFLIDYFNCIFFLRDFFFKFFIFLNYWSKNDYYFYFKYMHFINLNLFFGNFIAGYSYYSIYCTYNFNYLASVVYVS